MKAASRSERSKPRPSPNGRLHSILYDAKARDKPIALEDVDVGALKDQQLLWVDVETDDREVIDRVGAQLGLPAEAVDMLKARSGLPGLQNFGDYFHAKAVAVRHGENLTFDGIVIGLLVGKNFVVTVRQESVECLEQLRERERGDTDLGILTAESFAASLLDWHLSTYFEAVSAFEASVERLEVDILSGNNAQRLEDLQKLRRGASRLRRMLAPHRSLFAALARPDFRPQKDDGANPYFLVLDTHFERAMDMVANTRDLVIGSFELFTSHTAWQTNEVIRALTFFTVLLGALAVIAGVLGMNFDAAFFKTATRGFWTVLTGMGALALMATAVAKRRHWI